MCVCVRGVYFDILYIRMLGPFNKGCGPILNFDIFEFTENEYFRV